MLSAAGGASSNFILEACLLVKARSDHEEVSRGGASQRQGAGGVGSSRNRRLNAPQLKRSREWALRISPSVVALGVALVGYGCEGPTTAFPANDREVVEVCPVHHVELKEDTVPSVDGSRYSRYVELDTARQAEFPLARVVSLAEGADHNQKELIAFCGPCRQALLLWLAENPLVQDLSERLAPSPEWQYLFSQLLPASEFAPAEYSAVSWDSVDVLPGAIAEWRTQAATGESLRVAATRVDRDGEDLCDSMLMVFASWGLRRSKLLLIGRLALAGASPRWQTIGWIQEGNSMFSGSEIPGEDSQFILWDPHSHRVVCNARDPLWWYVASQAYFDTDE